MTGKELWASLLQEAIQGRLVEQRDDEPDVPQIGETPEDVPFAIPEKWKWVKLVSVCNSMKYGTAKKSKTAGLIPVIRMGNIQQGEIVWDNLVYTDDKEDIDKYELSENDILFNRTNSPELVGKTAIYRGERKAIYAGYLINIKYDRNIILGEYLNYILNSSIAKKYCDAVKTNGVCQANINAKKIGGFVFPLPPLDEQRRIVARLEELRPLVDEYGSAEAELSRLEADLPDRLRASLLQEAISGRLVEQRDDEPAVEQIGDAPEDVPFAIPEKWKWVTLRDVGRIVSGGTPKTSIAEYWQGGKIPWITPADLGKNRGNQFISHGEKYITQKGLDNSSAQKMPRGSVIFSSRAPIGYVAIAENALCTNQGCKSVVNSDKYAISEWIYYSLICRTPDIQSRASGTTFREISGGKFGETWIPLPPLAEQRRIVARLEELLPEVATLKG